MADIPLENPHKYGSFDDDITELADGLAGRPTGAKSNRQPDPGSAVGSLDDEVDANVLRQLIRDSASKYGTLD